MLPIKGKQRIILLSIKFSGVLTDNIEKDKMFKNLLHLTSVKRLAAAQKALITSERGKCSPASNDPFTHWLGLMKY